MKWAWVFCTSLLLFSCNEGNLSNTGPTVSTLDNPEKENKNGVYLCEINNIDWSYTKASGIVFTEKNSVIRKAVFIFKKDLEKDSEAIQVEYNLENNTLIHAWAHIKRKNTDGNLISEYYMTSKNGVVNKTNSTLSGRITLSDSNTATGTANFKAEHHSNSSVLKNSEHFLIHVSNLKFSGISYSDLNKTFGN